MKTFYLIKERSIKGLNPLIFILIALFSGNVSSAQDQYTMEWHKEEDTQLSNWTFSCVDPLFQECQKIRLDSEDNVIVAGTSLENGSYDFLLLKYSNTGELLWKQLLDISNGSDDRITGIFIDNSDNIIIAGISETSQFLSKSIIIKLDETGNILWESNYSDQYSKSFPSKVIADSSGNVFIAGVIDNGGFFHQAFFVCKFDANGNFIWDSIYAPEESTAYRGITLKIIDNTIVSLGLVFKFFPLDRRIVLLKHTQEGNLLYSKETSFDGERNNYSGSSHIDDAGNSYIGLFGNFKVIKYDPLGNEQWQFEVPTNLPDNVTADEVHDIITDTNGNVYITGRHYGENYNDPTEYTNGDLQVNKISSEGNSIYSYRYNNTGANTYDGGNKMFLGDNGYLAIGGSSGEIEGESRYLAIVLDESGEAFDIIREEAPGNDNEITSLVMDHDLNFYVTGIGSLKALTQKYLFTGTLGTGHFSENRSKIKVYPNPFSNQFQIETKGISGMAEFILYNSNGSIVYRKSFENIPELTIDAQSFSSGFYFYRLSHGEIVEYGKLVKK
ncbi:T9SS type A sorting domain-containing protein [Psychroflexus sp. MES1-P1E]|uniref:T9SS type A sorting domain-containing protein n=1 Tax=Psychroflexus sp. MES1-P1E TaxID=2058320 RepID=UPI000C7E569C|nr:T9SS type A sorting domain-containing protein [Psychroflexus sp. MES1-P1E]PKG41295.1 hypothetical protein CXF67_15875 [Psychroflexus sp. MES1-P1E]